VQEQRGIQVGDQAFKVLLLAGGGLNAAKVGLEVETLQGWEGFQAVGEVDVVDTVSEAGQRNEGHQLQCIGCFG
jgi:hypothetical protein